MLIFSASWFYILSKGLLPWKVLYNLIISCIIPSQSRFSSLSPFGKGEDTAVGQPSLPIQQSGMLGGNPRGETHLRLSEVGHGDEQGWQVGVRVVVDGRSGLPEVGGLLRACARDEPCEGGVVSERRPLIPVVLYSQAERLRDKSLLKLDILFLKMDTRG